MRQLNGRLLENAMNLRGWNDDRLARELKACGFDPGVRSVKKWRTGKLKPSAERIALIEEVIGYLVAENPKTRRSVQDYGIDARSRHVA